MGIQLAALNIPDPVILAPMSGVTDRPFRRIVETLGVGMVVTCAPENVNHLTSQLPEAKVIGEVVKQKGEARVVID